jgi:hypothetical protein
MTARERDRHHPRPVEPDMSTETLAPPPTKPATAPSRDAAHAASPASTEPPTFGEILDDVLPVIGVIFVAPPAVIFLAGPWLLLGLMLSGPFALLVALAIVGLAATGLLVALAALAAAPYVLVRHLRGRYRSARAMGVPVPQVAAAPVAATRRVIARGALPGLATWHTADAGYVSMSIRGEE